MSHITPEQLDECLPQTQCGLCGYGGCMPYAEAIVYEQAAINLCPPGGVDTLAKLGSLLGQTIDAYQDDMAGKAKPPSIVSIREPECIGCTKCINACPVDAIVGAAKQMHTVIVDACTGCDLCIPACPVDCIDTHTITTPQDHGSKNEKANQSRKRYQAREARLSKQKKEKMAQRLEQSKTAKQNYITDALMRVQHKNTKT